MNGFKELVREVLCLALAFLVSWWFLLRPPREVAGVASLAAPRPNLPMELTPLVATGSSAPPSQRPEREPERESEQAEPPPAVAEEPAPPPPELGTPEGEPREELAGKTVESVPSEAPDRPAEDPAPAEASTASEVPAAAETSTTPIPRPEEAQPAEPRAEPVARTEEAGDPGSEPALVSEEPAREREPPALELPAPEPDLPARESPQAPADQGHAGQPPPENFLASTESTRDDPRGVAALMRDPALLATAGAEISGEERRGFATVLLATPEDQLAIARFFGEELVLVPRVTLDPGARDPLWFRIASESSEVEEVHGRPPLERYRQYRDLFDYDYARLPAALRELRRRQASRRDVYVFAALIPAREWAVVVARRAETVAQAGRELSEVRRFVLRYLALGGGAFDLSVDHIVFADGSRYSPLAAAEKGARTQ